MVLLTDGSLLLRLLRRQNKGRTHQHGGKHCRRQATQNIALTRRHDNAAIADTSRQHGRLGRQQGKTGTGHGCIATDTFVLMPESLVNRCQPLPAGSKLCILGAGFCGRRVAALAEALNIEVLTTRRNPDAQSRALRFDTAENLVPTDADLQGVTHLLSTIPPGRDQNDPVLHTLKAQLSQLPLRWAGYLSTTGVYGDTGGAWVSEADAPKPSQERSRRRLVCEQEWLSSGLPVQILRLPGIYGPGRSPLAAVKAGTLKPLHKPGQVFCRVHVDDIAAACLHLMHCSAAGQHPPVVNICDHEPAPSHRLQRYAADLLGCDLPETRRYEDAEPEMSAMARSFWAENRRVSNDLLCQTLGYTMVHPNFRSGLAHCLEAESLMGSPTRTAPD